jgi:hypothetical protein
MIVAKRKSRPKKEEAPGAVSSSAVPAQSISQRLLGQQLGVTNIGRLFDLTDRYNGPHLILKEYVNGFARSWSAISASPVNGDWSVAFDTTLTYNATLYPATPIARSFEDEYWPVLDALLQSGIGSRQTTTMYEVVRYFAMTSQVIDNLRFVLNLNYLSTLFNWAAVAPYSGSVPPVIWELTSLFDCNDVGINDRWRPLYQRLVNKVLPPYYAAALFEAGMPYLGDPYGHCVRLNWTNLAAATFAGTYTIDEFTEDIDDWLDYLESDLKTCHNVLTTFLPFKIGTILTMFKGYDPSFEEVDYNSQVASHYNFGTASEPDNETTITIGEDSENGDSLIYYHMGSAPILKSVVGTPIFDVYTPAADQIFYNASFWISGPVQIIDDQLSSVIYDGTPPSTDVAQRYTRYYPNRWIKNASSQSLLEGIGRAGMIPCLIAREEILRANRSYLLHVMGLDAIQAVLGVTGGSGVRTIQKAVGEAWSRRM